MSGLEDSIYGFLDSSIPQGDENKQRDINLILSYYGFGGSILPTLEELAGRLEVGSKERARQILNKRFRENTAARTLNGVRACATEIASSVPAMASTHIKSLCSNGVLSASHHPADVCRLLIDLGFDSGIALFTPTLEKVTRSNATKFSDFVLLHINELAGLKEHLKKALRFPSSLGAIRITDLDLPSSYSALFPAMIANIHGSWTFESGNDLWFLFENRENRLLNLIGKTFQLGQRCQLDRLAESIHNALHRWTPEPKGYKFPPCPIVREYITSSRFTSIHGDDVEFSGELTELTDIENDVRSFFQDQFETDYQNLRTHLESRTHSGPLINKAVNYSPLVFVDKSGGRQKHVYSAVISQKQPVEASETGKTRYDSFRNRLKRLSHNGTDAEAETIRRREQAVLAEWLFEGKETATCAICKQVFEVSALVCAHKKPRSTCSESERTDPHIVMPLCLFGCDYLYERRYCRIEDGVIVKGEPLVSECRSADVLQSLIGNKIDAEWIKGPSTYFAGLS